MLCNHWFNNSTGPWSMFFDGFIIFIIFIDFQVQGSKNSGPIISVIITSSLSTCIYLFKIHKTTDSALTLHIYICLGDRWYKQLQPSLMMSIAKSSVWDNLPQFTFWLTGCLTSQLNIRAVENISFIFQKDSFSRN